MRTHSKKRLAQIASGQPMKGTFKIDVEALKAKRTKEAQEAYDALFGRHKASKVRTERQRAMAAADKWFSMFIRLRDSDENGRVKCITCSHVGQWKSLQNGHFITRGHQSTRYDEQCCNTQCRGCNYNGGQHLKHAAAIDAKYGAGTAEALQRKGAQRCNRTTSDLVFIAKVYKERVENFRAKSPGKFRKAA